MKEKKLRIAIEKILKNNGWISEDIIAEKLNVPFLEVHNILEDLEKGGLVETRYSK